MAANVSANDAYLKLMQKRHCDYFDFWRDGIEHKWRAHQRHNEINNRPHPRSGQWPGLGPEIDQWGNVPFYPRPIGPDAPGGGPSDTEDQARHASRRLAKRMEAAGFHFVKILGWGGLGVASLYETLETNPETGLRRRVVCKMDLQPWVAELVGGEAKFHKKVAGARHVVQRVVLQEGVAGTKYEKRPDSAWAEVGQPSDLGGAFQKLAIVDKPSDTGSREARRRKALDVKKNVLFIEFLERGDFQGQLCKAAVQKKPFPDRVLWELFECLFRGVIGLAYPRAFQPPDCDPTTQTIPQVTETAKGLRVLEAHGDGETIVHFDLDPCNILVGGYDQKEHAYAPIFKIADLGLCVSFDGRKPYSADQVWELRKQGKTHILAPEQFSQEWDWVARTPRESQAQVAGNYNWWTNLYQVGLVMWSAITHLDSPQPPIPELHNLLTLRTILSSGGGDPTSPEWTYGGFLLDKQFDSVDITLRNVVARCMCDDPKRRPTIEELERLFYARQAQGEVRVGDYEAAKKWSWGFFGRPLPLRPPPAPEPNEMTTADFLAAPLPKVRRPLPPQPPPTPKPKVGRPLPPRPPPTPQPKVGRPFPPLPRVTGTENLMPVPLRLPPRQTDKGGAGVVPRGPTAIPGQPGASRAGRDKRPGSGAGRARGGQKPVAGAARESRVRGAGEGVQKTRSNLARKTRETKRQGASKKPPALGGPNRSPTRKVGMDYTQRKKKGFFSRLGPKIARGLEKLFD